MFGVCQGLGQLRLVGSQQPVLFHLGQALRHTGHAPAGSHAPFLETHTRAEVEWLLRPGTRVTLNARKIRGCYLPLQVSIVYSTTTYFHLLLAAGHGGVGVPGGAPRQAVQELPAGGAAQPRTA